MENRAIKILAIDDNPDNLTIIKAIVRDVFLDSVVYTSLDGINGIDKAIQYDPDVILLDVVMPSMDGFEVCKRLKSDSRIKDIPVVFVTALKEDKENRITALESGAEGFLAKPIDVSELTAMIRAMVKIKDAIIQKKDETERLTILVNEKTSELYQAHKSALALLEELRLENETRRQQEAKLIYMSFHDGLTDLYNRRYFEDALVRIDIENNLPITIAVGDVNGLKMYNEMYGHHQGDLLLKYIAFHLTEVFRKDDLIARLGGDEFAILMINTDAKETELLIKKFKDRIAHEKALQDISISFGYDSKVNESDDLQNIMIKAENSLYRFKLYESKSLRSKTIEVIMNALVEKSSRELNHSKRVSILCEQIALKLNFREEYVNQIKIAGLVHDIGKIGIDEKILNKSASLDPDEWVAIKGHPEAGYRILNSVAEFSELAEFIFSHHERWDGKGYPRSLKGERIPIEARIITIADSYDAMTSNRSYREQMSLNEAVLELKRNAGLQFDPQITKIFVTEVLGEKW
ncbi:HD domain-containing protein [Fusibacter bizertensis]